MGDVVNLRQFRKAKGRKAAEAKADANRLAFGRTKSERDATTKERARDERRLEGHRREDAEPTGDE